MPSVGLASALQAPIQLPRPPVRLRRRLDLGEDGVDFGLLGFDQLLERVLVEPVDGFVAALVHGAVGAAPVGGALQRPLEAGGYPGRAVEIFELGLVGEGEEVLEGFLGGHWGAPYLAQGPSLSVALAM